MTYPNLYELFRAINNGQENSFTLDGEIFEVKRSGFTWYITHTATGNMAALYYYVGAMIDLQGPAACLLQEKKDLWFNKEGNLSQPQPNPAYIGTECFIGIMRKRFVIVCPANEQHHEPGKFQLFANEFMLSLEGAKMFIKANQFKVISSEVKQWKRNGNYVVENIK